MPRLDRVYLINAAGFDEVEFPVSGHCQVIGVNGHGKSTLLRTVLFFYLGVNDKPPYALDDTKKDFVSHYLGDPPSYLIYDIARGEGAPHFHIAVTRPAGRIQFLFVDAPYRREYYVDGRLVLPIEDVQMRWREARCAVDEVTSYEAFQQRIYGIIPSTFAVFRPAAKSGGQFGVLSRIISGIFTVSQLDADKLKSALTCGVRGDAEAAELDLLQLKEHLTHFHRVNRAVKTYLRHEQDAVDLVELFESFEAVKIERIRALEDLVRAAKLLPELNRTLTEQADVLRKEQAAAETEHAVEVSRLKQVIEGLGKELAVLDRQIKDAEAIEAEYESKEIARKTREVEALTERADELRLAQREVDSLTAKYADENDRKQHLLAAVGQNWADVHARFQQRRLAIAEEAQKAAEILDAETEAGRSRIDDEHRLASERLSPRRVQLAIERSALNKDWKVFGEMNPPAEIGETEAKMKRADELHREAGARQEQLRGELALAKEKLKADREKLTREAEAERDRRAESITRLEAERSRMVGEVDAFDASLARFFQNEAPARWPSAAKSLNRETLFTNAETLGARSSSSPGVWGVEFSTEALPEPAHSYDREDLAKKLRDVQKALLDEKDASNAAQIRFVSEADAFEKHAAQVLNTLEVKIVASGDARSKAADEGVRWDNALTNLRSQFAAMKDRRRNELEERETTWKQADGLLQKDLSEMETALRARRNALDQDFRARKVTLTAKQVEQRALIDHEELEAVQKRDEELARIERDSRARLTVAGANAEQLGKAQKRISTVEQEIKRISDFRDEVAEYRRKKVEWIDRLPGWRSERNGRNDSIRAQESSLQSANERQGVAVQAFTRRNAELDGLIRGIQEDQQAADRFRKDARFIGESGFFDREDLPAAAFHRPGATRELLQAAEHAHEQRDEIGRSGDRKAKAFLNGFDAEILDRKVLGFSPIHEYFDWFIFVGSELRPFVNHRGIAGLKRTQTQQFEQLVRNICNKNAAFDAGIRQVRQTADSVQARLAESNFVDVLDSIELRVERTDNQLTRTLAGFEAFAGISFGQEHDLFGKRADQAQVDQAIDQFERLVKEIGRHSTGQLSLTDYFDFLLRVHENGRDMGWRKSLNHIGSTGTDYLVKMLIYLALIEVYRERAIDPRVESTVHCVLDETGVLAPKYVRKVLAYASARGILLITAGHSQQTTGFEHWVLVRKHGQRFGAQTVLRKILKCD